MLAILKEGFGIEIRNSGHTEFSNNSAHDYLHGLRRNRNSACFQSAFPHLSGLFGVRKNCCSSAAHTDHSDQVSRNADGMFETSARACWLITPQPRGAFCLLRRTKKVAVATTTSRGTAVNSSRAIADQSVYTAERPLEVEPSSQQTKVLLRDCTTRHSRRSFSAAGRCCRCPANECPVHQPSGGSERSSSLLAES